MEFQGLEGVMEESAGLLREVEAVIAVEGQKRSCFHGGRSVRRNFPARLFRRRIMRMKMGEFGNVEPAASLGISFSRR